MLAAAAAEEVSHCVRCPHLAATRKQTVFGTGSPTARLMFIGEAPGADEDRIGQPFVGRAGQLLTDMITKGMGLRREDVYIANVLKCRPPDNRTPTTEEAANCSSYLEHQIAVIRPEFLCLLGKTAAMGVLGVDASTSMGRLRGRWHHYRGIKTLATYHPSYLLRNPPAKKDAWEDLQLLIIEMGLTVPGRKRGSGGVIVRRPSKWRPTGPELRPGAGLAFSAGGERTAMPIHDWTRVDAGLFHAFRLDWITLLSCSPALPRNTTHASSVGHFRTTTCYRRSRCGRHESNPDRGRALPVSAPPSKTWMKTGSMLSRRTASGCTTSGTNIVAVVEIVSPGNKTSAHARDANLRREAAAGYIAQEVHLLVIDLFPPSQRDPQGIHKAIWDQFIEEDFELPVDKPLTLVPYEGVSEPERSTSSRSPSATCCRTCRSSSSPGITSRPRSSNPIGGPGTSSSPRRCSGCSRLHRTRKEMGR